MPETGPLDLAELDPPVWHVLAAGKTYGPYTMGQLRGYRDEGRILPGTPVARGPGGAFRPALEVEALFGGAADPDSRAGPAHNFLLVVPGPVSEDLLGRLGELSACLDVAPGVFVLRARRRLAELREAIAPLAGDRMILVDASSDRLAWSGLGPQTDRALRELWITGEGG